MNKSLTVALLAACLAGVNPTAEATTMVQLSTHQMVDAADTIVRATITEVWAEEDENGVVWTRAQLEVSETYKGDSSRAAVVIDQVGGQFGRNVSSVIGGAKFSAGEEGVFFLERTGNGRISTIGISQGKYTLRLDPYSRKTIAQRFSPAPGQRFDHRFLPLPEQDKRLFLTDLEATIQARVQAGWDGKAIPGTSIDRLQRINAKEMVR